MDKLIFTVATVRKLERTQIATLAPKNNIQAILIGKTTTLVDSESELFLPIFMFLVWKWPLVAVVIISATKEEVSQNVIKSAKSTQRGRQGQRGLGQTSTVLSQETAV